MKTVDVDKIIVGERGRKTFPEAHINSLIDSISDEDIGLLYPIIVSPLENGEFLLEAGECRLRAVKMLNIVGIRYRHQGKEVPHDHIPYITVEDAQTEVARKKRELAENNVRLQFSWQESDYLVSQIAELNRLEKGYSATDENPIAEIAEKVYKEEPTYYQKTKTEDALRRQSYSHLPEVQKAKSHKEADKIISKKLEEEKRAKLSAKRLADKSPHTLLEGDCKELILNIPDKSFDVILADPIYGIDMHKQNAFEAIKYKDGNRHDYDDSLANFEEMFSVMPAELYRVAKEEAHLYLFCDINRFFDYVGSTTPKGKPRIHPGLATRFKEAGWSVWGRPLVWSKGNIGSLPRPEHGPRYTCEYILFASKGDKKTTGVYHDCINIPQITGHNHPAGKPPSVYYNLLKRSVYPGDTILDFAAGSGPIFPAANEANCSATGMELDPKYVAEARLRFEEKING